MNSTLHACGHRSDGPRCPVCTARRAEQEAAARARASHAALPPALRQRLLVRIAAGEHPTLVCADLGVTTQRVHHHRLYDEAWGPALDAALTAGRDAALEHGRPATYRWQGCRCPECRGAHHGGQSRPRLDLEGLAERDERRRGDKRRAAARAEYQRQKVRRVPRPDS